MRPKLIKWLCENIYFKYYEPQAHDVVIDIGAGLGHEAIYMAKDIASIKYIGIEVQPAVYECLCNTFYHKNKQWEASCFAIRPTHDSLYITSSADYQNQSTIESGYIEIPVQTWEELINKHEISQIDLLKINIEGGEVDLLPSINDLSRIKRIIISAHDFRADAGEGEHFRTSEFVKNYLQSQGFKLEPVGQGWLSSWIYAER